MEIIKRIENCNNLTDEQINKAVKDLNKMRNEPAYANLVWFQNDNSNLPDLFAWEKSELGQVFWTDLYAKLSNYIELNKMEETKKQEETTQLGIGDVSTSMCQHCRKVEGEWVLC